MWAVLCAVCICVSLCLSVCVCACLCVCLCCAVCGSTVQAEWPEIRATRPAEAATATTAAEVDLEVR